MRRFMCSTAARPTSASSRPFVDLSRGFPALLRPGRVTPQDIADVLGEAPRLPDGSDATAPRASGTLKAHYAPRTPLALLPFNALEPLLAARAAGRARCARRAGIASRGIGPTPRACTSSPRRKIRMYYARELYGLLRALDRANVARILIEKLPDTIEWIAVNDRLGRAAAAFEAQRHCVSELGCRFASARSKQRRSTQ